MSNKSLINCKISPKDSLIELEEKKPSPADKANPQGSANDDKKVEKLPKTASRLTAGQITISNFEKQGIILEDQNESRYNSSGQDDSSSSSVSSVEQKSVSSGERKSVSSEDSKNLSDDNDGQSVSDDDSNHNFRVGGRKTESNPLQIQQKLFQGDILSIQESKNKMAKKDDSYFSLKEATLLMPKRDSQTQSIANNSGFKCSPESWARSMPRSQQSSKDFVTDLNLLKTTNQNEKSKAVLSRLKMMI